MSVFVTGIAQWGICAIFGKVTWQVIFSTFTLLRLVVGKDSRFGFFVICFSSSTEGILLGDVLNTSDSSFGGFLLLLFFSCSKLSEFGVFICVFSP